MTSLLKIPVIAAFSVAIAAFAVTPASAERGDGHRHYRGESYRSGGDHHRGRDVHRSQNRDYRGNREHRANREYRPNRSYSHDQRADRRNYAYRGHDNHRQENWRGHRRDDQWRGDRRHHAHRHDNWRHDHRRHDHDRWRGDRRHYSGHHGHRRHGHYDYRRSWRDHGYYWHNRHHWASWRPYYGPIWNGYRYDYWRNRGCVPVTRYWTWDGRPALVGGIQCYDPYGAAYIVNDDYYPLHYY